MKKLSPIYFLLALLAGACSNPLEYQSGEVAEVIIMNADLHTYDTTHSVWLSLGEINSVGELPDARLNVYINGEFAAEASTSPEPETSWGKGNGSRYVFSADIHPGDEVRLEASWRDLHAQATVTAPAAASIASVDTLRVKGYNDQLDQDASTLHCKLRLVDCPGEKNWYYLLVTERSEVKRQDADGNEFFSTLSSSVPYVFDQDPILSEGMDLHKDGRYNFISDLLGYDIYCPYTLFTDKAFSESSADVEIAISELYFQPSFLAYDLHVAGELTATPVRMSLTFHLLSIPYERYCYVKTVSNVNNDSQEWNPLFEPATLPSNVKGGLGFVSIASDASMTLASVPILPDNNNIFTLNP